MILTEEQKELIEKEFLHPGERDLIFEAIDFEDFGYLYYNTIQKLVKLVPELKKLL